MKKRYMTLIFAGITILPLILFLNFHPVFGGKASGLEKSTNYKNGKFQNLVKTSVQTGEGGAWKMLKDYASNKEERTPINDLATLEFDKTSFKEGSITWFGHSTVLMNLEGKNIITDPVFYKASPVFFGGKTFSYTNPPKTEDLPELDFVLISHDHYDHLDYKTIIEIDSKVKKYLVPLGVGAHLEKWGVNPEKIIEHDWYNTTSQSDLDFTFTPTKHFSGRGLTNRNSTLWGSWVIKGKENSMFFSGDTGYFDEFKKIGELYGPFDMAFIENGAYNESWSDIHMFPEQSVQVGIDLRAENIMPIHWGKFDLSLHSWYEPIERFSLEADKKGISYTYPKIGEIFDKQNLPKDNWWNDLITK